jgi:hypothetical protein
VSLGSKKLGKPSNPFTTKKVSITLPALKIKKPKLGFKLRSPFTKA